jgi:hypothetical protein
MSDSNEVEIRINGCAVKVLDGRVSGRHIKRSALEQGIDIQLDSPLHELVEEGTRLVGDDEHVQVFAEQRFSVQPSETAVLVNDSRVAVAGNRPTGKHIKESAMEQGVDVQLDCLLFAETFSGHQMVIHSTVRS